MKGQSYRVVDGYCELVMTKNKTTKIDVGDMETVFQHRWHARQGKSGIWYASANAPTIYLHRLLLGLEDTKKHADHISGDGLDNRRANIHIVTRRENLKNMRMFSNNTSGMNGVHHDPTNHRYVSSTSPEVGKRKQQTFIYHDAESQLDALASAIVDRTLFDVMNDFKNGDRPKHNES